MRQTLTAAALAGLVIGVGCWIAASQAAPSKKSDSKIQATAKAGKAADGKQTITVHIDIDPGWHIYANPNGDTGKATTVKVEGKKKEDVRVEYPPGKPVTEKDIGTYFIYEGSTDIKVTVPRTSGDSPLKLKVEIMACNEKSCLPAGTVELSVP